MRNTAMAAILLLSAAVASTAAPPAAPTTVPRVATRPQQKGLSQMTVEELKKIQIPANARLRIKTMSAQTIGVPVYVHGPDLVIPHPYVSDKKYGPLAGFPRATFNGWVVSWRVTNQGNQLAAQNALKIECDIIGGPPGSASSNFLQRRWCSALPAINLVHALPAGRSSGSYQTFLGEPLPWCGEAGAPHPRFTVTVDPTNAVTEPAPGETNNVYVAEFCLAN
jgi:hypothetical protein